MWLTQRGEQGHGRRRKDSSACVSVMKFSGLPTISTNRKQFRLRERSKKKQWPELLLPPKERCQ